MQVSDHLEIGRDESDEAKVEALSSIHAMGDLLFVKVGKRPKFGWTLPEGAGGFHR